MFSAGHALMLSKPRQQSADHRPVGKLIPKLLCDSSTGKIH